MHRRNDATIKYRILTILYDFIHFTQTAKIKKVIYIYIYVYIYTYIYEGWNFNSGNYKGLSPCDFDLIPKMKEPLRGIRFRSVPEILQAVDRSIRTINTTGVAKGILRLPHRWQRVVHNAGDYSEGQ